MGTDHPHAQLDITTLPAFRKLNMTLEPDQSARELSVQLQSRAC